MQVVWPVATKRLLSNCQSTDKTVRLCPGYLHEPFLSQQGEEVISDAIAWILQHST